MQTSAKGVAVIEHHEGVVLRAYRCPAGIWTIGAGLTAASGVIKPKAGMVITKSEATNLLQQALRKNYEPRVARAMSGARQHEFDAGVSFDFNTGAIHRATWVKRWIAKAAPASIRAGLLMWNKGAGRVLPGLVRRREDEARLLLEAVYPQTEPVSLRAHDLAKGRAVWALPVSITERARIGAELHRLGYAPYGESLSGEWIRADAVRAFQRDHGLTVDGIIGRATLSTLQRRIDAAARAKPAAAAPVVAASLPATGAAEAMTLPPSADWLVLGLAAIWGLWVAYQYRDAIAAKVHHRLPRLAAFLRSF